MIVLVVGSFLLARELWLLDGDPALLKTKLLSYGSGWSVLLLAGLQMLQVVFAFVPGELVELAAGYMLGPLGGFLLCFNCLAISSSVIFLLVRRFGKRYAAKLQESKAYQKWAWLHNAERLKLTTFWLYLIPGTPKDLLGYLLPLTKLKYRHFIVITSLARIPSILTSTIAGAQFEQENWLVSASILGGTALLSLVGMLVYQARGKR